MSGDVQPRKRKDKKRRKDEGYEQIPTQSHTPIPTTTLSNDDVNIHVHKEAGTGGGICAKLVFFVLLSGLVVVLGMIITQYRGLTDVDTVDTKSKFAQIFEGWIDVSHRRDKREIEESNESHNLDHEAEDDMDNVSDPEDEEEHEISGEDEDVEGNDDDNEASEENEEDEEQQDEEHIKDLSEEDQSPEGSDENQLDDDDDSEVEASNEEKERYDDIESDEKDEETDEEEQEVQNVNDSDEINERDEEDNDENADEDNVSTERGSREEEDQDDDTDEDKPAEDSTEESDEKVAASIESQIDADKTYISPDGNQQESSGSANVDQHTDNSDSDRQSDDAGDYEYSNITNKEDYKIKDEIDEAQKAVQNE